MNIDVKISAFSHLAGLLATVARHEGVEPLKAWDANARMLHEVLIRAENENPWFTPVFVRRAMLGIAEMLGESSLRQWMSDYEGRSPVKSRTVAVVMAGNVPAVGFHDFLSVLMAGHKLLAKISGDDKSLIPAMARVLVDYEKEFEQKIQFTEDKIKNFDAVIATGSNNTARYFEYYFGKYPHIIRKNRNAVAVLDGNESPDKIELLAEDIFLYFGLGCRNVSKLFVPEGYDVTRLYPHWEKWAWLADHHKYRNNYDYNKSLLLVNGDDHYDNGFLLLRQNDALVSPVSVLNYEYYTSKEELINNLKDSSDDIQCIVSDTNVVDEIVPIGEAQSPKLWDYADGVDTMAFLLGL